MNLPGSIVAQIGAALAALALTVALVEPARRLALRGGATDRPAAHKAHHRPTPYLGGVAIVAGTLVPTVLVARHTGPGFWVTAAAAAAAAALGLWDDLRSLSARTRLAVETILAVLVTATGGRLELVEPRWLDAGLTICWIVVVTNSFNLLDNADGALATVAAVTALPLAAVTYAGGQPALGLLLICLSLACTGFLPHNTPPARIFMGDTGSLFIGLLIAAAAARARPARAGAYSHAATLLLLVFLAAVDTALVVVSRRLHGRPLWQGGTDHVAHRLRRLGLTGNALVAVLLLVAAVSGLSAALVYDGLLPGPTTLVATALAAAVLVAALLAVPGYPAVATSTVTGRRPLPRAHVASKSQP
ncbi:MAG TPA: MraY family glycosyltransferase [Rugosimonospora sp.]